MSLVFRCSLRVAYYVSFGFGVELMLLLGLGFLFLFA